MNTQQTTENTTQPEQLDKDAHLVAFKAQAQLISTLLEENVAMRITQAKASNRIKFLEDGSAIQKALMDGWEAGYFRVTKEKAQLKAEIEQLNAKQLTQNNELKNKVSQETTNRIKFLEEGSIIQKSTIALWEAGYSRVLKERDKAQLKIEQLKTEIEQLMAENNKLHFKSTFNHAAALRATKRNDRLEDYLNKVDIKSEELVTSNDRLVLSLEKIAKENDVLTSKNNALKNALEAFNKSNEAVQKIIEDRHSLIDQNTFLLKNNTRLVDLLNLSEAKLLKVSEAYATVLSKETTDLTGFNMHQKTFNFQGKHYRIYTYSTTDTGLTLNLKSL